MPLDARKKQLLCQIVEQYIKQAEPVSSAALAQAFDLSPATIRNEMAELEKLGLIYQPHTSAGRVPSEEGFKLYLSDFLKEKEPAKKVREELTHVCQSDDLSQNLKSMSKKLADLSNEAVIIVDHDDIYYAGLSNLFTKPEFNDRELILNFGRVMDHMDEMVYRMFDMLDGEVKIMIGRDNPFGQDFGALVAGDKTSQVLMALLGPMRMEYEHNLGLLNLAKNLIEEQLQ